MPTNTISEQVVNGTTYAIMDSYARGEIPKKFDISNPLATIASVNDNTLNGMRFVNAGQCEGLPSSTSGVFYQLLLMGYYQIAAQYSNSGIVKVFSRNYANNKWYPWTPIDNGANMNAGIVANEDTAPQAIAKDSFVIWKEKIYIATEDIASGATLSGGNLSSISDGGLNELQRIVNKDRNNIEKITGIYTRKLTPNQKWPYCDIQINVNAGEKLFFRLLNYNGDISNFDFIYLFDTARSTSLGGIPEGAFGREYDIENSMTTVRVIAMQNENTTEDIEITFALYVEKKGTYDELRIRKVIQEKTFYVTSGNAFIATELQMMADPGDVIYVQVDPNGCLTEMVVGYLNNGTAVNNVLGIDLETFTKGYAEIKTNFDNDSLRFYTKAAAVVDTGKVTIRWANLTKLGITPPMKHYSSFSILGDSYSTYVGYTNPTTNRQWYPTNDPSTQGYETGNNVTDLIYTWWYILANETELYMKNNASYSGSSICYDSYGEGTTDGKTTSFIQRTGDLEKSSLIFVFGGTNDSWAHAQIGEYKYSGWTEADLSYFAPAVAYLIDKLTKEYIGAQLVFIENDELGSGYKTAMETVCSHYGVPLIKLNNISKTYNHPNIVGMRQIAEQVKTWVNGPAKLPMYMK